MTFGRKGLGPGDRAPGGIGALRNTGPRPADDDIARKREAFLAAERERRLQSGEDSPSGMEPGYQRGAIRPERSLAMAYVLWFLFGQFSVHRFYLGRLQSAMIQFGLAAFSWMLILGGISGGGGGLGFAGVAVLVVWGLWVLGDVFFIHSIHRKHCRQPGELASAFS